MKQFLCPKCKIILLFCGLTPNGVYEQYQCRKCKRKFLHWKDTDEMHGWYDETSSPWENLIYEYEMPKNLQKEIEVVQFT